MSIATVLAMSYIYRRTSWGLGPAVCTPESGKAIIFQTIAKYFRQKSKVKKQVFSIH